MSKERIKLAPNVAEFLKNSAEQVGAAISEYYEVDMWHECTDGSFLSPIEHIFYMAFHATLIMNPVINTTKEIHIFPQEKIGRYKVDFLLSYIDVKKLATIKQAIIELDGHNFHDKDEKQRRHEKQRDRFFQAQGYRIFHFTGKEVTDAPYMPVCEALAFLLDEDFVDLYPADYI